MELTIHNILARTPIIPILTIYEAAQAVPLARALAEGGLDVVEITLRTDAALEAMRLTAREVPGVIVGAGTVTNAQDMNRVRAAGAHFAVSPGTTRDVLTAADTIGLALLPGVTTASEVMAVRAAGLAHAKFFPAEPAGGVAMLKALAGPFPDMRFCPTGGIGPGNFQTYLSLPNVICVGGSWVAPHEAVLAGDWQRITALARRAADGNFRGPESR